MTTAKSEDTERAELLERLQALTSARFAAPYAGSSLDTLRDAIATCQAQAKFYADCGFVDAQAR